MPLQPVHDKLRHTERLHHGLREGSSHSAAFFVSFSPVIVSV